jgi:hypothetical protein
MKRAIWLAAGLLAVAMTASAAHAASYTFDGGTSGVDPLAGNYVLGTDNVGLTAFAETADQQADNTQDVVFTGGHGVTSATSFTLTETSGADDVFDVGFDQVFFQDSAAGQIDWTLSSLDAKSITFTAPEGVSLQSGERFSADIALNSLPSNFAYSVTWSDGVSAAPEPSTWTLMILGLGGMGLALRQARSSRQRTGVRAA